MHTNPPPRRRAVTVAAGLMVIAILAAAGRAQAFLGIGDTSDVLLADLIANSIKQLGKLGDTVDTLRKTYDQGRKVAGYAEDAYALAASFQHFSVKRFGARLQSDLSAAYPDAARYRDDLEAGRWTQGGRLTPYLRHCLDGVLRKDAAGHIQLDSDHVCTEVREELKSAQVLAALADTFGSVPPDATDAAARQARAVDAEVAAQISAQAAQWNRTQRVKQVVEAMQADCAATSDGDGPSSACEAAAQRAQMDALAEQAETNRLLAEQTRLLALQLEQRNADLKREMQDALARRTALATGARAVAAERITIETGSRSR